MYLQSPAYNKNNQTHEGQSDMESKYVNNKEGPQVIELSDTGLKINVPSMFCTWDKIQGFLK